MSNVRSPKYFEDEFLFRNGQILGVHRKCSIFKPWTWLSARIQKTTCSKFDHVGILRWCPIRKHWRVIEALSSVKDRPLYVYSDEKVYDISVGQVYYKGIPVSQDVQRDVLDWSLVQVGDKYTCSDLVIKAYHRCGVDTLDGSLSDPGYIMRHTHIVWCSAWPDDPYLLEARKLAPNIKNN